MSKNLIGQDHDGVTSVSLKAIEALAEIKTLVSIEIKDGPFHKCEFNFATNDFYSASGFSVGYNGEGPQGLYKAIKMFYLSPFFDFQAIAKMSRDKDYRIDFVGKDISEI